MRFIAACAIGILGAVQGVASAAVIAQNGPVKATNDPVTGWQLRDGTFSDGLSSDGNYFYSQALGQKFSVASGQTAVIGAIDFWGSTEYIASKEPWAETSLSANVYAIEISILRITAGTSQYPVVHSWTINTQSMTQLLTGTYVPDVLSPVFQLSTVLSGNKVLTGGDYLLTIGGLQNNADGDSFAWTDGIADGSLPESQAYATVGDIPTEWGRWSAVNTGVSGAFVLTGTPAPGALALLGMAGFTRNRRRR